MSTSSVLRVRRPTGPAIAYAAVVAGIAAVAAVTAPIVVTHPGALRLLFAAFLALVLFVAVLGQPVAGVVTTLAFLVVLAFVRRVLIADAGWSGADPLLLVGPLVAAVLVTRLLILERRPLAPDGISILVTVVLALTVLQVGNPAGGGVASGLGGLLFVGAPLLWFYIGRELAGPQLIRGVLIVLVAGGAIVAVYGLAQTELGFPSWDRDWFAVGGYVSLNVGDTVRAFGTFSSSAEYAFFLGGALAALCALCLTGRPALAVGIPVLAAGLFLASARAPLLTAAFTVVILLGLKTGSPRRAVLVAVTVLVLAVGVFQVVGPALSQDASGSGNDLVSHQLNGVTDPLNSDDSTLLVHLELVVQGFARGVVAPLGSGTGAANQAASKLGGGSATSQSSEVDISNAFISLGLVGGLLYLALVVLVLRRTLQGWFAGRREMLPIFALLTVTLGQWLTGGHYALSPLTWVLVGYVAAATRKPADAVPAMRRQVGEVARPTEELAPA